MARSSSPRRNKNASDDEDLQILEEYTRQNQAKTDLTGSKMGLYTLFGLLTSLVPTYMFTEIYGVDIYERVGLIFVVLVTIIVTCYLSKAYHNLFARQRPLFDSEYARVLQKGRARRTKEEFAQADARRERLSETASSAYSIWFLNAFFVVVCLSLAFYIFPGYNAKFNYLISTSAAAYTTHWFSTIKVPKKKSN
mmetsp:Transcript_12831/g.19329  ORF Transcript_12831/g.19329 Transcript_12831/m.19329 type:complete len:195 (+) Transcript_12831:52-636(+)